MGKEGRYSGVHMTVYGTLVPGAISLARWANKIQQLTPDAKKRIKILDWHRAHGKNVSLTSRRFGVRRATVREWQKRFDQQGILGLVEHSRRPNRLREPTTSWQTVQAAVKLRKQYAAWSKYKIRKLMEDEGFKISASTVGRIFTRKGLIDKKVSRKRKKAALHPRARFPYGLKISRPGDLVQMDTKHIVLVGGRKLYQFTVIDVLTKWRVLRVYPSQSSQNGKKFLQECIRALPFPVRAVQTDNGAPFLKYFEQECKERKLPHYFIYPRTPKQNTYVERSHGSDEVEFYQQGYVHSDKTVMQEHLLTWERVWNEIRPHEALNYLTPKAYLKKWKNGRLPTRDIITLQT